MNNLIKIYHDDWIGECYIENNHITRKDNDNEKGEYNIEKNKLIIYWEKWHNDIFYTNDFINYLSYNNIQMKYSEIFLLDKDKYIKSLVDYKDLNINIDNKIYNIELNINNLIILFENYSIIYKKISNFYFINQEDYNQYFILDLFSDLENKKNKYIFNKNIFYFFNFNNTNEIGKYKIENNLLKLCLSDDKTINYYSNTYYEEKKIYKKCHVIKPNKIYYDDKVLFSNISLCNNKIIFTSIYYLYHPWNYDELKIIIPNNKIIKKNNFSYENYESSVMIIIELQHINESENLIINYLGQIYNINLTQLNLLKKNIYSMTLFKDDYKLLDKYLEYYYNLGVECFFLYYNNNIDQDFIDKINIINKDKYNIYIVEWDFIYWWKHINNPKHHHAQTMAINDSLNILKNYSNYILYNDLDEYIKLEKYNNFNELISNNRAVDIFQFKCKFCTMGNERIKYSDFKEKYDENNIILGNLWDKFREKNLIKCKKFYIFGIHDYIENYTIDDNINTYYTSYFYHFLNFEEKYRPELMKQYIS